MSDTCAHHYPPWLRLWHWSNAALFLVLAATGLSLHFAAPGGSGIPFDLARGTHNVCGILLTLNYGIFGLGNIVTGNWVHYRPRMAGFLERVWIQTRFYGVGIFRGEPQPFPPEKDSKFNPMQQAAYLGVMLVALPVLMVSGWFYLFPEWLPFQEEGMWLAALVHTLFGFLLLAFLIGHVYLATAGETPLAEFRKMLFGHH